MDYTIKVGGKSITFSYDGMGDHIDVDELTKIDSRNISGENTTISADLNMVGLLRAEVESQMAMLKLEEKVYIGKFVANLRKQGANNGNKFKMRVGTEEIEVKLTEKALDTCYHTDPKWYEMKKEQIQAEKNFNSLDSLYWSIQDKSKRLSAYATQHTPED